ncbi:MAG TPA: class I poly(R)-hydroxyalkanoic acid synthase, partial [Methylovirgula sp.]
MPQEAIASGALLMQTILSSELKLLAPPRSIPQESIAPKTEPPREKPAAATNAAPSDETSNIKPDFDILSQNLARIVTQGAKALGAFLEPYETGRARADITEQMADAVQTFGRIAEYWLGDPTRAIEAQKSLSTNFLALWAHTLRRLSGEAEEPIVPYDPNDKRYTAPQWRTSAIFDFLRQAHAIASDWAANLIARAETAPDVRFKAEFYLRQISSALAPSNFVATNPELLRETLMSNAENLVRGTTFFAEDLAAGGGTLRIRQSDPSSFTFGVNMAASPGKVVYRNDLIELIQYAPSTEEVYRRPLLVIPPWINKFYILDLNPQKSFVRFMVAQGFTVFLVSWVNPDAHHKDMGFDEYLYLGIEASLDVIEEITGERKISTLGYCVGGTLLSIALAFMARKHDDRVASATFLTTQTDFADAGDLKIFTSEPQIAAIEEMMKETGYLDGGKIANVFNMLRPNDLIWSFFVNNYMRGKPPLPFDLLTWNSDSTRVTAANHSFYLRNCYLENTLAKGEMTIDGEKLDLSEVTIPIYHLAAREDHIAPARSVYTSAKAFPGDVRYVLAGSGHIAGVINPADSGKYGYWTGSSPRSAATLEEWSKSAAEHAGSWWPDWATWLAAQAPEKVPARTPGSAQHPPLADAPG